MRRTLILDIDGTICASPPVVGVDFAGWEREIARNPPPVVEGAREGVRDLLVTCSSVLLLTGRSERLRAVTEQWIADAFPMLRGAEMDMRQTYDLLPASVSKITRLGGWRSSIMGWSHPIVIVDDDVAMRVAVEAGDRFLIAPGCWASEARAFAYAHRPVEVAG